MPSADGASSCSWSAVSEQEITVKPKQMIKTFQHAICTKISQLSIMKQDLTMILSQIGQVLEPSDYISIVVTQANKITCYKVI